MEGHGLPVTHKELCFQGNLNTCTGSWCLIGTDEVLAIASWLEVAAFLGATKCTAFI